MRRTILLQQCEKGETPRLASTKGQSFACKMKKKKKKKVHGDLTFEKERMVSELMSVSSHGEKAASVSRVLAMRGVSLSVVAG